MSHLLSLSLQLSRETEVFSHHAWFARQEHKSLLLHSDFSHCFLLQYSCFGLLDPTSATETSFAIVCIIYFCQEYFTCRHLYSHSISTTHFQLVLFYLKVCNMPRNFLVKRTKRTGSVTYRQRSSEEEYDDLGFVDGDLTDAYIRPFNSPDSGYSQSPVAPISHKDPSLAFQFDRDATVRSPNVFQASGPALTSSHIPLTPYFTTGYKASMPSPVTPNIKLTLSAPPALGTKRPNSDSDHKPHRAKKPKAARKLTFEEDNRSPVHGTIIREEVDITSKTNSLGKTSDQNGTKLGGDFLCKLCKESYSDPLSLASHKCSCIVHVEYRCPECDKVFNCPANLASHRRWHKPKPVNNTSNSQSRSTPTNSPRILPAGGAKEALKHYPTTVLNIPDTTRKGDSGSEGSMSRGSTPSPLHHLFPTSMDTPRSTPSPSSTYNNNNNDTKTSHGGDMLYHCDQCGRKFRRPANLRRHMQQHGEEETFPCQYCGRVFNSLTSRAKHVLTHAVSNNNISNTATKPSNRDCEDNYDQRVALDRLEKLQQHGLPGEMYACKYCASIFPTSPGLTRHINKMHPSENRQVILLQMPALRT